MEQKFVRAFGRVFAQNTYEQGLRVRMLVNDVVTCTLFCTRGYLESRDSQTGRRMQDNYPGLVLGEKDFVCKEYDLLVTEPAVVFCYDKQLNHGASLEFVPLDVAKSATINLANGTNLFLCEGTLIIDGRLFAGPTAIAISSGDKIVSAETRCLGLLMP